MQKYFIVVDFNTKPYSKKISVDGYYRKNTDDGFYLLCNKNNNFAVEENEFLKIDFHDEFITIKTDLFNQIPAFYAFKNNILYVSDVYQKISSKINEPKIDEAAFWELVIFENTLLDRTIYQNIKISEAGQILKFGSNEAVNRKYYNSYNFEETTLDNSQKEIYQGQVLLEDYFSRLDLPENLTIPISGGVDSRLLLAYSKEIIENKQASFLTYGFSQKIREYIYAKKSLSILGLEDSLHYFHKLTPDCYINSKDDLASISGGMVGMQNSHLFSYLQTEPDNPLILSGILGDALFGYKAKNTFCKSYQKSSLYQALGIFKSRFFLSEKVFNSIEVDISKLWEIWQENKTSLKDFDEWCYFKERNSKFISMMANCWRKKSAVIAPYGNYKLLSYFSTLPYELRKNKQIITDLLRIKNKRLAELPNVSTVFRNKGVGLGSSYKNFEYLFLKKFTSVLQNKLKLPIQIPNKYETETHNYNILKYHQNDFMLLLEKLEKNDLITMEEEKASLKKLRGTKTYQILSIEKFL